MIGNEILPGVTSSKRTGSKTFSVFFTLSLLIVIVMTVWLFLSLRAEKHDQLELIQQRGVLRVGALPSTLTYDLTQAGPYSLDYELAQHFANYLEAKLDIRVYPSTKDLFAALAKGEVDMVTGGLLYDAEQSDQFLVSPSYSETSLQLIYRQGSPRPSKKSLTEQPLSITRDSPYLITLAQLKKSQYPTLEWQAQETRSVQALLLAVVNGKLDYTVADSATVAVFQRIHPQLAVALDLTDAKPNNWHINRKEGSNLYSELLEFFNQSVNDGTVARLEEKYLGHINQFDYVDTHVFLSAIEQVLPVYRHLFEKYSEHIDWQTLAAIAYQESHWNPQAVSPTGVKGLMMLTLDTAGGMGITDRVDPEQSIQGGARYLKQMLDKIPESIPEDERLWFALAAYNMGLGHLLDVRTLTQKLGGNPDSWVDVKQRLPLLSQKYYYAQTRHGYARGYEAYRYVDNIRRYRVSLTGYLQQKEQLAMNSSTLNASLTQRSNKTE